MRDRILIENARQYDEAMRKSKLSASKNIYQQSMSLLICSALQGNGCYSKILNSMALVLRQSKGDVSIPMRVWMLGRMAFAANFIGDRDNSKALSKRLLLQLKDVNQNDTSPLVGWSWAYLLLADHGLYNEFHKKLQHYSVSATAADQEDKDYATNLMWTLTMNLYAAAMNKDSTLYQSTIERMLNTNKNHLLLDAIALVPTSDYRYWLTSICRYAFTVMSDSENLKNIIELKSPEVPTVSMDAMLAYSVDINRQDLSDSLGESKGFGSYAR